MGLENVANWSVRLNGQESGRCEFSVSADGAVTVFRKGLFVIIK